MNTTPLADHFHALRELNRAFLSLLQQRAQTVTPVPEAGGGVTRALCAASSALLDTAAEFPGALFRLRLDAADTLRGCTPQGLGSLEEIEYHLGSSVLHSLRHLCRQSAYQAQVVFGIDQAEVAHFRALTLDELRRLAGQPNLLVRAHADRQWFWQGLLGPSRPESRRLFTLMALQPTAPQGWPTRRPPHLAR